MYAADTHFRSEKTKGAPDAASSKPKPIGQIIICLPIQTPKTKGNEDLNPNPRALLNINIKNEEGDTPLTLATKFNNVEIVRILLYYGADVDKLNDGNASAYHIVTSTTRNIHIRRLLKEYDTQYYHPSHDLLFGNGNW